MVCPLRLVGKSEESQHYFCIIDLWLVEGLGYSNSLKIHL